MFNNSSHVDASHSVFSEVHRDQYYNARSTVQGQQTVNTIIHGNQIIQDTQSNLIEGLRKAGAPSAAHDSAQRYPAPKCIEGTRTELLSRISSWVDEPDGKAICWLNGRPGSGKSAVSQTVAERYASENRLAGSFFFSRRDLERRTTRHVVPTLTTQLLGFLPSIRPAVIAALERDYMIPMKVLREQMERLLLEPLSSATETPDKAILIILDALDECDDENLVAELVTLVALLPQSTSLPLRLLITSRSEPWLQSRFQKPEISSLTLFLEINAFSAEADIRSFLRRALDNTYDEHLQVMRAVPRPWPSSDDLDRIVSKSAGLFIFALTVIKFVGARTHNPLLRLQAVLEDTAVASTGSAYADLDLLYRDAISAFPDPDVARLVLGVVYCMSIPMSVSGLHKLLQRPDVDVRLVVPALSSVLLASEDGEQPIQFYHASFRDFLTNPQRSQKYAINPDAYHRFMAQLCFETMVNSLKRDMCGIGDPAKANSEIPDLVERRQAAFDEALLYACRYWSRHLAQLPSDGVANEVLLDALKRFSTTALLRWIEALSIFDELESAVVMLRQGTSWLKTLREPPEDMIALFQETEHIVLLNMEPISQCALHIYLTAILFVPQTNIVYETFKHQSYGTIITRPAIDDYFDVLRRAINIHCPIHSVVFSPGGDLIATASEKQGVQLWNALTGGNVANLGDRSSSLLVTFSPSGAFLAAAFEGGTIAVWDPKVGREHLKHEGCHSEPVTCLVFSPSSALLASSSRDRTIQVWSMETAQSLYRLATHEGPVTTVVFSGDSQRLFSGSDDNLIIIWDMLSGKVIRGIMGHRKAVNCLAVSRDDRVLVSGSEDKTVKLWDTSSGKCTRTFSKGHGTGVRSVHFFNEDKYLLVACSQSLISWDISRNKSNTIWAFERMLKTAMQVVPIWEARVLGWSVPKRLLRYLTDLAYEDSQGRFMIAYASQSPSFVFVFQGYVFAGSLPVPMNEPPLRDTSLVTRVAVSPDGVWAAAADPQGSLEILDLTTERLSWEEAGARAKSDPFENVSRMVPSPNGKRFVFNALNQWCLIDENYHILKRIDTGMLGTMRSQGNLQFKFSGDGSVFLYVLASLFRDDKSTMRVFDAVTGDQRIQFKDLQSVHSFVASTNGAWIACCHGSLKVEVFGVADRGRTSMNVSDDGSPMSALVFSDDARLLVGGSEKGVVCVWDCANGACKATFEGSASKVTALVYGIADTPGGTRIAVGREDGSIAVWCPSTSASHDILRSDQATVKSVGFLRFSDDRSRLDSSGEDGAMSTWVVPNLDDADMTHCALCPPPQECNDEGEDGGDHHDPGSGASDNQTISPPHLLSRSDPEDTLDGFFQTAYRIRKDGWLVKGDRRVIWIPHAMRPHGKETFYAFKDGSVAVYTPSELWVFLKYVAS